MELLPVVSSQTGWIALGVVAAGFAVWAVFLWRHGRKKGAEKKTGEG